MPDLPNLRELILADGDIDLDAVGGGGTVGDSHLVASGAFPSDNTTGYHLWEWTSVDAEGSDLEIDADPTVINVLTSGLYACTLTAAFLIPTPDPGGDGFYDQTWEINFPATPYGMFYVQRIASQPAAGPADSVFLVGEQPDVLTTPPLYLAAGQTITADASLTTWSGAAWNSQNVRLVVVRVA